MQKRIVVLIDSSSSAVVIRPFPDNAKDIETEVMLIAARNNLNFNDCEWMISTPEMIDIKFR